MIFLRHSSQGVMCVHYLSVTNRESHYLLVDMASYIHGNIFNYCAWNPHSIIVMCFRQVPWRVTRVFLCIINSEAEQTDKHFWKLLSFLFRKQLIYCFKLSLPHPKCIS